MEARKFVIYDGPSVTDPSWQVVAAELFQGGGHTLFADFSVIKTAIQEVEIRQAEIAGAQTKMEHVLKMLHLDSYADFLQLAKDRGWKGKIC
jgi:hypothetical protein